MKKIFLLLLLGLASAPAAFSQARAGGNLSSKDYEGNQGGGNNSRNTGIGIKGGYNLSNLRGDGKDIFKSRDNINTYHAGVYGQYGFTNFASVQLELLYSRKGFRNDPGTGLSDTQLNYLSIPVLFVGNITDNISFHVGPQLSLLTKVNADGKDLDIKGNGFNSTDISAVIGAEARIGPARVGVRYDLGFANIYKDGTTLTYVSNSPKISNNSIHNQTFQVYVGIGITQ